MPVAIENQLKKSADKAGVTGLRKNAYVYGTLQKIEKGRLKKSKRKKKVPAPAKSNAGAPGKASTLENMGGKAK